MRNDAAFGIALQAARERRDMTQGDVAALLGVHQVTVSRWEAGRNLPDPEVVFHLERVVGARAGALSRYLGYVPAELTAAERQMLSAFDESDLAPAERQRLLRIVAAFLNSLGK